MIIIHASWRICAKDRRAYDDWFKARVLEAQQEPGCLMYDYYTNPLRPDRGYNFEVWADQQSLDRHLLSASHVDIVRNNSRYWQSEDFECTFWDDAGGWRQVNVPGSHDTVGIHGLGENNASENALQRLVAESPER